MAKRLRVERKTEEGGSTETKRRMFHGGMKAVKCQRKGKDKTAKAKVRQKKVWQVGGH